VPRPEGADAPCGRRSLIVNIDYYNIGVNSTSRVRWLVVGQLATGPFHRWDEKSAYRQVGFSRFPVSVKTVYQDLAPHTIATKLLVVANPTSCL
jgi:hypothetical protein